MRLRAELVVLQLSVLGALLSGCGGAEDAALRSDSAGATSTESGSTGPAPGDDASPTCGAECRAERRAEREAIQAERCRPLLDRVSLTYRITATPSAGGSEIGLHMILENRSEATLSGGTGGALRVSPGRRSNQISWGGSSADVLYQKPGTTSSREVWHDRQPPGWHPVGDRVTSFSFYTYTYPSRRSPGCDIPASVVAPPGLVDGHPSGRWTQGPDQ